MDILIIIVGLFLLVISLISIALLLLNASDSIVCRHDTPTSQQVIAELAKIIKKHRPEAETFYDLGCGRGTLALAIKKNFPDMPVTGIDSSSIRILLSRLKALALRRNVKFIKSDMFKVDLSGADICYTYIWYDHLPPLEKKLKKELKSGAIVICNTSHFPNWQPKLKYVTNPNHGIKEHPDHETLFVYVKGLGDRF